MYVAGQEYYDFPSEGIHIYVPACMSWMFEPVHLFPSTYILHTRVTLTLPVGNEWASSVLKLCAHSTEAKNGVSLKEGSNR